MRPEHWLFIIPLRLRSLFRWAQTDQELDDELRDHVERKTEEYVAQGIAPEEARRRARLDLGGIEQTKEKCRDARRVNWIQDVFQDIRYGLRILRKSPSFTAAAVLTIALGIGANTTIFAFANTLLFRPPGGVVSADRLVSVWNRLPNGNQTQFSYPEYTYFRDQNEVFTKTVTLPLDSAEGLKSVNAKVEPVTYKGRKAIRVTDTAPQGTSDDGRFVVVAGSQFEDGLIEVDVAGDRFPAATEVARGFVGVAFRVAQDGPPFEAFYLRPYNGRSDDQLQRNHSAQYISSPEYPWNRLRQEFPGKYETYVDLVPSEWTKMKIEVKGEKARLYVNGAPEPTLIVNHLLHGSTKGAVALFISLGSVAHFSNLRVSK